MFADRVVERNFSEAGDYLETIRSQQPMAAIETRLLIADHVACSLHGLVAGDGYGIPSIWIRFSDRPFGDGFKFRDYLASVGRSAEPEPLMVTTSTSVDQIHDRFSDYELDIDLDAFLAACPFLDTEALARNRVPEVRSG